MALTTSNLVYLSLFANTEIVVFHLIIVTKLLVYKHRFFFHFGNDYLNDENDSSVTSEGLFHPWNW